MSGISASSFFYTQKWENYYFFLALAVILIWLIVSYGNKKAFLLGLSLLFFAGGVWLTANRLGELNRLSQNGKNFSGEVIIVKEPENKDRVQKIVFAVENNPEFSGQKILANTAVYPEYSYGDKLKIECLLEFPENKEDGFDYRKYLAKDRIYYLCQKAKITVLEKESRKDFFTAILKIKKSFQQNISQLFPVPQSGLLAGLLLGGDNDLPESIKNIFSQTGMTHIVAVSGYNITIIAEYLMGLLIFLGLWRRQAFYVAVVAIGIFVFMIGLPASAVRAGIMGTILLWAMKNGRLANAQNAIVFAAGAMLIFNPLLLRYDVGFQLSFLATLGIVYVYPILENYLMQKNKFSGIWEILLLTLAAQAFVLPIILINFERLSLISPLANLLVLPIIPLTMLLGFFAATFYFVSPWLGEILAWLAFLPLKYEVEVIKFLASFKFASLEIKNFSWVGVLIWYLILLGIIYKHKMTKKNLTKRLS
jgi:competence protein ComEC